MYMSNDMKWVLVSFVLAVAFLFLMASPISHYVFSRAFSQGKLVVPVVTSTIPFWEIEFKLKGDVLEKEMIADRYKRLYDGCK